MPHVNKPKVFDFGRKAEIFMFVIHRCAFKQSNCIKHTILWYLRPSPYTPKRTWPRQLRCVQSRIWSSWWRGCSSSSTSVTKTRSRTSNCWSCSSCWLHGCTARKERTPQRKSVFITRGRNCSSLICIFHCIQNLKFWKNYCFVPFHCKSLIIYWDSPNVLPFTHVQFSQRPKCFNAYLLAVIVVDVSFL